MYQPDKANESSERLSVQHTVRESGVIAVDLLARLSGLSKLAVKDAMAKGAVSLKRGSRRQRLRRAKTELKPGDRIELHYDRDLLRREPPAAKLLEDRGRYSVWLKPAGLLAQGTEYGDHCSLPRVAEKAFDPPRQSFPVHRLDREAVGIMLVAHEGDAAARLSNLFQSGRIEKRYLAQVEGAVASDGTIETALDGKPAVTHYSRLGYDAEADVTTLGVVIETGRLHQIRRHLASIGHPVVGDPRYGSGSRPAQPLRLAAVSLRFVCPVARGPVAYTLDPSEVGF